MAFPGKTTYDSDAYYKDDVSPKVQMVQETKFKFLNLLKYAERPLGSVLDVYGDKYYQHNASALAANFVAATDTTIDVTAGHGVRFAAGMLIRIGANNVLHRVSLVATDTLTIAAAATNTVYGTAVNVASLQPIYIISRHAADGEELAFARLPRQNVERTCSAQNFFAEYSIAKQYVNSQNKYAENLFSEEKEKAMLSAMADLERHMITGARGSHTPSSTVPRFSDAIMPIALTENAISGGSWGDTTWRSAIAAVEEAGFINNGRVIMLVPPAQAALISALGAAQQYSVAADDFANFHTARANTQLGEIIIMSCPHLKVAKQAFVYDYDSIEIANLENFGFHDEPNGQLGASYSGQVTGTYGLKIFGRGQQQACITWT